MERCWARSRLEYQDDTKRKVGVLLSSIDNIRWGLQGILSVKLNNIVVPIMLSQKLTKTRIVGNSRGHL